jgi:geranylgeranyl pyrophosphate synthase
MIAGQVADMDLCELPGGVEGVRYIHRRKTAALCRAAVRMGGLCAAADEDTVDALGRAGELMGLAFQVTDDLLDATAAAEELGKTPGKDAQAGKRTYLAEMDPAAAAAEVRRLTDQAREALDALPGDATRLRRLAELLAGRDR